MMPLLYFATALAALAQQPAKLFPYDYAQRDLANGLRVIVVPTDFPNVVALQIVVQTGSRNEIEPGKSGFAHLFEHVMFRGTKNITPEQYEGFLKKMGAASNASTWDDRTNYHTTFSREDLELTLRIEADRFQNLSFPEDVFRTETLAVLGEYNKSAAEPGEKLIETLYDTAFDRHTYKHTTIGFLKDIEDMPNQYEYSRTFFERWYRPEFTTLILVGDVKANESLALVEKYWAGWKSGAYKAPAIPVEPAHAAPRTAHVDWPSQTLPWLAVAFHGAAYADDKPDSAALDLIAHLGFSPNSELYNKLVIADQTVDRLDVDAFDHADPHLFTVMARVKRQADVPAVRARILAAFESFTETLVPAGKLEAVKNHLRYRFALSLNDSESIAHSLMHYISLRRTPETINRLFDRYGALTAEDVRNAARRYFTANERVVVTLSGKP